MATRFMRGMYGSCQQKVRHATRAAAQKSLEKTRLAPGHDGRKLRVYHCDRCDGWHVGHAIAKAG